MKNEKLLKESSLEELFQEIQRRRKRELTKDILIVIGKLAVITTGMLLAPNAVGAICRQVYKNDSHYKSDKRKVRALLHRLRQQELIRIEETKNGETILVLTDAGRQRVLRYQLGKMQIQKPKQWDKKWRVIIFDIPEKLRQGRDALRAKMMELGFYQLQKSAWVYPYECKDEIDFISNVFGVGKYLLYFVINKLENETFLIHWFKLE